MINLIMENLNQFKDKIILELGCGTGIVGLFLAKHAKQVYLSDVMFKDYEYTKKIYDNIKLNKVKNVSSVQIEWGRITKKLVDFIESNEINVVIASDIFYQRKGTITVSTERSNSYTIIEDLRAFKLVAKSIDHANNKNIEKYLDNVKNLKYDTFQLQLIE
ncbi:hypothetical protein A3Q56_00757 [Intoshia linei]|uniref:Methyltransferase small domain-containing protein n=1 Tax=Intoshia linei TaxID=1819745 RepID=A0A177BD69_9BILA|nr:hypothetical protein A3Q56_00757 [Intoshia linei]